MGTTVVQNSSPWLVNALEDLVYHVPVALLSSIPSLSHLILPRTTQWVVLLILLYI